MYPRQRQMSAFQRDESIKAYQKTSLKEGLTSADPYYITKMLYQGLYERLAQAKGAILRGDLGLKSKKISGATQIIENLRNTLDFSYLPEFAQRMYDLYTFMLDKLVEASCQVSTAPIDAVLKVLMPIKEAWDNIPYTAVKEAASQREAEAGFHGQSLASGHV